MNEPVVEYMVWKTRTGTYRCRISYTKWTPKGPISVLERTDDQSSRLAALQAADRLVGGTYGSIDEQVEQRSEQAS
jgi:hypothetical protein